MNFTVFDSEELIALIRFDMRKERYDSALEKVKHLLAAEVVSAEVCAIAGSLYATLSLFNKAKSCFEKAVKENPEAINNLFQLGMVNRDMGDYQAAIEIWKKVVERDANHTEALFFLGDTFINLNNTEEARDFLYKLLETASDGSKYIPLADDLLNRINTH